ncbi:mushroom body large-type Kenyon cell-specific protein 1-like [Saccostrea echinata]|uniref:mushroom body large-type Kenyon cell-specific protein 1-like n=1 Tax=Saccostrea echinata TaxID=191078 RepID=UPI002A81CE0D|nr:mushroom body large-type Kenyon cell-specific protein 1-like [Saccostrea echinata]
MVDCGNSRCSQERRAFRKELLSWSKKVPIAVGLERIAEEFGGKKNITELLLPFNCLEAGITQDWKQEQTCFFCESRLQNLFEAVSQLMKEAKDGKSLQDNPGFRYLQELLPYCPQFYTDSVGRELLAELRSTTTQSLDNTETETAGSNAQDPIELKIPHIVAPTCSSIPKKRESTNTNCKKSYTDEELLAAVSEIQSGKLGTRRASVLYGIPRSTLRNKIFKMGVDKQDSAIHQAEVEEQTELTVKWTDLIPGASIALLPFPMPYAIDWGAELENHYESQEKKLEYLRKKHNLSRKKENFLAQHSHELKLPILRTIIKKLAEERIEMERNALRVRKQEEFNGKKILSPRMSSRNGNLDVYSSESSSDIIIPSFQPMHNKLESKVDNHFQSSLDKIENAAVGETLKDIIVKTISEKVKFKSQALSELCQGLARSMESDDFSQVNSPSPAKKSRHEDGDKKKSIDSPTKKTRPKRGQYRKYNSQLLMEAVKAVQRGEMSVHRAGSYYGVPHSTLEYKVKERHLLRQKKIKEQREQREAEQGPVSSNTKKSTEHSKTSSEKKESKKQDSKEEKEGSKKTSVGGSGWIAPYLPGGPGLASLGGLYNSSGFALNTPASELLRKLQHKVQSKGGSDQENYEQLLKPGTLSDRFLYLH